MVTLACVQALRRGWKYLDATLPARRERERLEVLLVGGEARQLDPTLLAVRPAAHGETCKRAPSRHACGEVGGKTLLRQEPVAVVDPVDVQREWLAVGIYEFGGDRDHDARIAAIVGVIAPNPHAYRVEAGRHGHGRGRRQADDAARFRQTVGEMQHTIAEKDSFGGGGERPCRIRRAACPALVRDKRQQHRSIVGGTVRPFELVRTRPRQADERQDDQAGGYGRLFHADIISANPRPGYMAQQFIPLFRIGTRGSLLRGLRNSLLLLYYASRRKRKQA